MPVDAATDRLPFVIRGDDEWEDLAGSTDFILMTVRGEVDGNETIDVVALPQFGIEVRGDLNGEWDPITDIFSRLFAHYAALTELPDDYITTVETLQRELIERLFLPYVAKLLARNPSYFAAPPEARNLTDRGRSVPA